MSGRDRAGTRPADARTTTPTLFVALLAGVLTAACGSDVPEPPRTELTGEPAGSTERPRDIFPLSIEDDAGRTVRFPEPPSRIVSLVPSANGILLALGQREHLVARTDFELVEGLEDLPSVGGGLNPSLEALVALEPDLVVRFHAESDPDTPLRLDAAEIPHVAIRPDNIADVRRNIGLLGRIAGVPARADSLWAAIEADLEAVSDRVAEVERPRVVFLGGNPPTVAGPETFLHELIVIAGGENAFADADGLYAPVSLEEVILRDPDLILTTEGSPIPEALDHIPLGRVPLEVLSPGIEVARSARTLARILHPERFP